MMIEYNTLMGVAAGLALILVPMLARKLYLRDKVSPEGWALSFGVLGLILTVLGGLMATTWPLIWFGGISMLGGTAGSARVGRKRCQGGIYGSYYKRCVLPAV